MEEKKYLTWYNKIGYGSGDIAGNVVYALLSSFVMIYPFSTRRLRPLRSGMNCVRITLDKVNENTIIKAVEKG